MIVFALKLLLAHAIGDFVLQHYKWVKDKEVKKHKSKQQTKRLLFLSNKLR
jgi:hypothetical protein